MSYTVRWKQIALDELAAHWISANSDDRRRITDATRILERQLRCDAHEQGESRSGDERIVFTKPLVIRFEVDQEHAVVRVLQVSKI